MNLLLRIGNYITRYAPSREKITLYLQKKKCQNPEQFLQEIGFDEKIMIDVWFRTFISLGKSERDIRLKLLKKGFDKSLIQESLDVYIEQMYDWGLYEEKIKQQIDSLLQRRKSLQAISALLYSRYPYFREEISQFLEEKVDDAAIQAEIERYLKKYDV